MIADWFCYIWMFNILSYFVPLYLLRTEHVNLKTMGLVASLPFLTGILGAFLGGYASKALVEQAGFTPFLAKRATISVCALLGSGALMLTPFFPGLTSTLALLSLGTAFLTPSPPVAGRCPAMSRQTRWSARSAASRISAAISRARSRLWSPA